MKQALLQRASVTQQEVLATLSSPASASLPPHSLSAHTTTLKKCPHLATSASCNLKGLPAAPGSCTSSDTQLFLWILALSLQMAFVWDPLGVTVPGPSPRTRTRLRFSKSYRYGNFLFTSSKGGLFICCRSLASTTLWIYLIHTVGLTSSSAPELSYCKHLK